MNLDMENYLPNTENQAGIKFEHSLIWLQPLTKQSPAAVNVQTSAAVKMRWDSSMNRQTCKEERFCFWSKSQRIKWMCSLGAQEAVKCITSSRFPGSTGQQTDIWRTGSSVFSPCCSLMLPWPATRVLSGRLKEQAVPWCKPPWSSEHEDCPYNETSNNCLLSPLTTSYQTFSFCCFYFVKLKKNQLSNNF